MDRKWGKLILFAGIFIATAANASDLLCDGTFYGTRLGNVQVTVTAELNDADLTVVAPTRSGRASGVVHDYGEYYGGHVKDQNGSVYWFYLNRYTGEMSVSYKKQDGSEMADFAGVCRKASKIF